LDCKAATTIGFGWWKLGGKIIGLGACIASLWILYKIFKQGYIKLIEDNILILSTEITLIIFGIVILTSDIFPQIIKEIEKFK